MTLGQMMMPEKGVAYYLIHQESGKYVHPLGGQSSPPNNTKLVFHGRGTKLALKFIFTENGQIQHVGSGKYIHPFGGRVGANVPLCLYKGCSGDRTGVRLIQHGSRTYLRHADNRHYVHPLGGKDKPDYNTKLVYFPGYRAALAIGILPAEKCEVVDTVFDTTCLTAAPTDTLVVDTIVHNIMDIPQHLNATVTYSRSTTNSFTLEFSEKLAVGVSTSVEMEMGIPLLASAKATCTMSYDLEFGSKQVTYKSTTTGIKSSLTKKLEVPARTSVKMIAKVKRLSGKVPFTMRLKTPSGTRFQKNGVVHTDYFFQQEVTYQYQNVSTPE